MVGWVVVLIVSEGWWVLAGAWGDGLYAVFSGDVDPSVLTVAAEWGWGWCCRASVRR